MALCGAAWGQSDSVGFIQMGSGYTPGSVKTTVEYNPDTRQYERVTKVGDQVIGREYMTFEQYQDWQMDQLMQKYWNEKSEGTVLDNAGGGLLDGLLGGSSKPSSGGLLGALLGSGASPEKDDSFNGTALLSALLKAKL